jgi:mono/diheme cytochrome c family protein
MKSCHLKTLSVCFALFIAAIFMMSLSVNRQEPWVIDAKYKSLKNPVKAEAASIAAGKELWNKYCSSCHGKTGLGDGIMAKRITTFPGDFSAASFQSMSDGEIFGKTKLGREEMPKYDGVVADEDIWHLVNYSRTFKK